MAAVGGRISVICNGCEFRGAEGLLDASSIECGAVANAVGLMYGVIVGEVVVSAEVLACTHIYI